jgi:hypothetical protein
VAIIIKIVPSFKWSGLFGRTSIGRRNWNRINESPLKRAGLLVRRIMINKIRKDRSRLRNKYSKPGQPPRSRASGHPFRRIYSIPDPSSEPRWVIIGHIRFKADNPTVPETHEFGKTRRTRVIAYPPKTRKVSRRQAEAARRHFLSGRIKATPNQFTIISRQVRYQKRPFAMPSLQAALPRIPPMWRSGVHN